MAFKVNARTILQLGAELISSDAVAFYELIKNSFDAGSPRVDVDVVVRVPHDACQMHLRSALAELAAGTAAGARSEPFVTLKEAAAQSVDLAAPHAHELRQSLSHARSWEQLVEVLEAANYIDIADTGSGMDRKHLTEVYLTIGTRSRLVERKRRED